MSDHRVVARSRADEATTTALTLPDLPRELTLRVTSLLEVRDILALRRTDKSLYSLSQDKLLWRGILRHLNPPLPRALRTRHLDSLSYPELKSAVLHSRIAERRWLKWREDRLTLFTMDGHSSIRLLDFLDDRWVVSVPATGPPTIWDTEENPPKLCELTSHSFQDRTWAATVAVDPDQGDIIIGLRREPSTLQILRAHLAEPGSGSLQLTEFMAIPHPNIGTITLEPSRRAVITELLGTDIQIRDWSHNQSVVISTLRADRDHAFEPILGVRLVGDYILSFKSRWIELFYVPPFPDADGRPTSGHLPDPHRFHLKYPEVVFTGASLSEPQPNPESPDNSLIVYILAYQTIVGFFYFRATIYNPDYKPSGPRGTVGIDLVGVYELGKPRSIGGGPRLVQLGAWLGQEGKRGIWVERSPNELKRFVVAASFDQCGPAGVPVESGDDLRRLREIAPRIELTSDIFLIKSLSPNDDVVRCAFSEATGKIVLGTRDNRIILL